MAEINFSIDRGRFKGLSLTAKKSERLAYFNAHDLTAQERLLYQVWASPSLKTRVFTGGQLVLSAGEVPHDAFVLISGEVGLHTGDHQYKLGPGSVIGLAQGLAHQSLSHDIRANTVTNCKVIPIDAACREIARINPGLKGLFRLTLSRILGEAQPLPDWLTR